MAPLLARDATPEEASVTPDPPNQAPAREETPLMQTTESTHDAQPRPPGEILYDAFYSGAIGGSIVALFFLLVDAFGEGPLFTPSLMGSVLFAGAPADTLTGVDMPMVAAITVVHFVSFALLGLAASFIVHEVELHARDPWLTLGLLFLLFEAAFAFAAGVFMPGVTERVGALNIAVANVLAAGGMGLFFLGAHRPGVWGWLRRSDPEAHPQAGH